MAKPNRINRLKIIVQLLFDPFGHLSLKSFQFGHRRFDLNVEFLQQFFDAICYPCLVAAGVGSNSHPVDAQFRQFRDTHVDRDAKYLPVDVPEFLLVLATKVADRAVIDGAARDQPHEVDRVFDLIFHDSRTAYAADHGEQQNLAQDARVNRRLADSSSVPTFPCGPVEPVENPIAQPVGMIVRNPFFEADWDQKYLNSLARWRLPVAFVERFLRH